MYIYSQFVFWLLSTLFIMFQRLQFELFEDPNSMKTLFLWFHIFLLFFQMMKAKFLFVLLILASVINADDLAAINSIRKLIYNAGFTSCASLNSLNSNTEYSRSKCGGTFDFKTASTSTRIVSLFENKILLKLETYQNFNPYIWRRIH